MKKRKQKGDCKTMKMKKFIAVVSMVGMLAAAMTGCGSGSDDAKDADKAEMQNMQETGTAQMTLQLFPVRMVREQEARLSNCSAFRKKLTEKKST